MISKTGYLLSSLKYGDSDAVLHCFTEEEGFQSFFLKGIYNSKNKKRAFITPLNELCFFLRKNKTHESMQHVMKFELHKSNDFHNNVKAGTIVFFIADFLNQVLKNENTNILLYREIGNFNENLNRNIYIAHLIFLINFLKVQGIAPLLGSETFLDPESGLFTAQQTHHLFGEEISLLLKKILTAENPYGILIPAQIRKTFLDCILVYCHYHVSDFKIPKSLEILQQIFE